MKRTSLFLTWVAFCTLTSAAWASDPNDAGKRLALLQSIPDASALGQAVELDDNAGCRFMGQLNLTHVDAQGHPLSLLDQGVGGSGTWSIDIHQQNCKGVVKAVELRVQLRNISVEHGYVAGDVVEAYPKP
ncbi:hypothetical protein [Pararobbsia silviterrae]|uniref:Uncharacterized protein n=1 Tax=Pararobbsia silviterrae TaxID=1792498 RepID=A0A494Y159_9BURK|nr:hypothetical protein [Pararobbsia silviterrae]RKP55979.1 hypothetical protein D7S86_12385 [Pararobbsia silviterrae]